MEKLFYSLTGPAGRRTVDSLISSADVNQVMYDQWIILQGVFFPPLVCDWKIFTDGLFVQYDIHLQIMQYARVVGLPFFALFAVLFPFVCF